MGVRGCWQNIETIDATIEWRRLTQAAAAEVLEVDRPKVSALIRVRLAGFSLDRLVRFLVLLVSEVEIVAALRLDAPAVLADLEEAEIR